MSYKITRGRVPPCRSEAITKPRPPDPKGSHITAFRRTKCIRKRPSRQRKKKPHALQRLPADELPHDRRRRNRCNLIRRKRHDIIQELQETDGLRVGRR